MWCCAGPALIEFRKMAKTNRRKTISSTPPPNRYSQIIEHIFRSHYKKGAKRIEFAREEIIEAARKLGIALPKNLGDVLYSFRYRGQLPKTIQDCAPKGKGWVILPIGRSKYCFVASAMSNIVPNQSLSTTKIPESTPGIILMYALNDEQALLAKLRYNRLIDIFTGISAFSLQSHLRTSVPNMGQVETDELYIGIDKRGAHYVFPVQAKGGKDNLSVVQIGQDFSLCADKFPKLICYPIAAQFMEDDNIALFAFEKSGSEIKVLREKHYQLVPPDQITDTDLLQYQERPLEE